MSIMNREPLPCNTAYCWRKIDGEWQIIPDDEEYQEVWKEREKVKPEKYVMVRNPKTGKYVGYLIDENQDPDKNG